MAVADRPCFAEHSRSAFWYTSVGVRLRGYYEKRAFSDLTRAAASPVSFADKPVAECMVPPRATLGPGRLLGGPCAAVFIPVDIFGSRSFKKCDGDASNWPRQIALP